MQNKPNLLDAQMNINKVLTKDYENKTRLRARENKANQSQFQYQYAQNKANFNTKYAKQTQSNPILSASGGLSINSLRAGSPPEADQ